MMDTVIRLILNVILNPSPRWSLLNKLIPKGWYALDSNMR